MLSMTGFGNSVCDHNGVVIAVQISSINRKQTDIRLKLPSNLSSLEVDIRSCVARRITRGAVQVRIDISYSACSTGLIKAETELARQLVEQLRTLRDELKLDGAISIHDLLQIPNVHILRIDEVPVAELAEITLSTLEDALDKLVSMKALEGDRLRADISSRYHTLKTYLQNIIDFAPEASETARVKLCSRVKKIAEDIKFDDERLIREIAILADRYDITEECTRLDSHLTQLGTLLSVKESVGRKMDFLIQECFREINTIASKCNNLNIANYAIDFKTELERIREQTQNIE